MTNFELSQSIKDYIKELFDDNIKMILIDNTKQISILTEEITKLRSSVNNIITDNSVKKNTYASVTAKNLEFKICKTVSKNVIDNINDNFSNKKSLIIFNSTENKNSLDKFSKRNNEMKKISEIIKTVAGDKQIEISTFHRLGKFSPDGNNIRPIKVTLKSEEDKLFIIKNAFKLKNSNFNKIGLSYVFSKEELHKQKELQLQALSKSNANVKYHVKYINGIFKLFCNKTVVNNDE